MKKVTLGGGRLGAGNKQKVELRGYERSTHDLSYIWKSTAGVGTLIPFMSEIGLPGDSFQINLDADIRTIPTNGPLFGSFKVQLDVFQCPVRLYIKELHNNKLKVGLNMANIKLPQLLLEGAGWSDFANFPTDIDNYQISPSCIMSYLNIRGCGTNGAGNINPREFNALSWLGYWDIYKNYYANKQEEIGSVIHTAFFGEASPITNVTGVVNSVTYVETGNSLYAKWLGTVGFGAPETGLGIVYSGGSIDYTKVQIIVRFAEQSEASAYLSESSEFSIVDGGTSLVATFLNPYFFSATPEEIEVRYYFETGTVGEPNVVTFPLSDIDEMREHLLMNSNVVVKDGIDIWPYQYLFTNNDDADIDLWQAAIQFDQEGLAIKTYQSDLFNNWLSTEWLDGENGINEITRVAVADDGFYLDDLNIMKKIYLMLNRVAVSDGSYKSWLETVYDHNVSNWVVESPVYLGGLIKELAFDEVVSTAESTDGAEVIQPLGTLAGKGVMTKKHKGGYIDTRCDEPCVLLGIVSLTPRLDYSQGNKWDVNLQTMDDFHKPQLDGIGFQELIVDQMSWWTTKDVDGNNIYQSAGKQPAWVNYMTNVNQTRGNFAIDGEEMFMTLNRKYEPIIDDITGDVMGIADLTTYIDPTKYNDIFSYNKLDAQNFWVQIKVDIKARRKMSAKVMPNL